VNIGMNFVKKILRSLFVFSLFFAQNAFVLDADDVMFDDSIMYDDIDVFDDPDIDNFLDTTEFDVKVTDPKTIVDILIDLAKADKLLQEDIYLKTSPLNKRNILDYPEYISDKDYRFGDWVVGSHIFYNQTSRMFFCRQSDCISSYLNITGSSLLGRLEEIEEEIKPILPDFDFDIVRGLSLFQNATVQDRRVGALIYGFRDFDGIHFKFKIPLAWRERNYFLTCAEREALEREFGAMDPDEEDEFACKYIISDRLGFGDLRLSIAFPIRNEIRDLDFRVGAYTTVPLNFTIIEGIKGRVFRKKKCRPTISFTDLFDLAQDPNTQEEALKMVFDFGIGALEGLSSILLDTRLGNDRNLGIGILLHSKTPIRLVIKRAWAQKLFWKSRMTFEYLLPDRQKRCFIKIDDSEEFESRDFTDDEKAAENLAFLERKFVEKFYPFVFDARVHPGIVFMWTSKLSYESKRFGFDLGWDTWIRSGERLRKVYASKGVLPCLDVEKARRRFAYQWKPFGSIFYKARRPNKEIIISLSGDGTFASSGIGKDFSIALGIESNF